MAKPRVRFENKSSCLYGWICEDEDGYSGIHCITPMCAYCIYLQIRMLEIADEVNMATGFPIGLSGRA